MDGRRASYRFAQPTYPGDPNGPDDPDPLAHQASQVTPVGGPDHNPLPPACTPQVTGSDVNAQDGQPCPADKLVITPQKPLPEGHVFHVTVAYTGRPGVHLDGDGTTEGWFRSDDPSGDGGFVTTEPVGTEDWMPLNNHPSAKPTYDFHDTVNRSRTAIANGRLLSVHTHRARQQVPARLADLPLALRRTGRELPGREQRRPLRPAPPIAGPTACATTRPRAAR